MKVDYDDEGMKFFVSQSLTWVDLILTLTKWVVTVDIRMGSCYF